MATNSAIAELAPSTLSCSRGYDDVVANQASRQVDYNYDSKSSIRFGCGN